MLEGYRKRQVQVRENRAYTRKQEKPMDKVKKIIEVIKALMEKKFTGYIKVNFSRGNVGRIEKFEEILKK
ncbi:MAG: hypothetical protein STSR0002_08640 [Smithella sp.]